MNKITFEYPYTPQLSKNKRYAFRGSKKKNPLHQAAQDEVSLLFKAAMRNNDIPLKRKIWIGYTWHRENMRGDITNFLNPICDAIKECLTFDDNWFSVSMLDWEIDKENPRFEITVEYD